MHKRLSVAISVVLLLGSLPARAEPESPESVVARYHRDFEKRRWLALHDYLHPDDAARLRKTFLFILSKSNRQTEEALIELYGAGTTLKSLADAPADRVMRPLYAMMNERLDASKLKVTSMQVLGSVFEGDLCHVVYRWQSETPTLKMSQVEVHTLRRYKESWLFTPPMNLESALPTIERALEGR